ncbi:AAA family ATPase [Megasphaera sp. DJF_B143]|uniref:AAA family ATPase n=1 Tax=Megasphaera sp. DJF_B143 TaxID=537288 RepID=UPI00073E5C4D|nr:AAA family ATPase [Megasphaera sp. DJF_B143]KUH56819.1 hypothetical protein AT798_11220 [Megasphaera sp. DJF_B143]
MPSDRQDLLEALSWIDPASCTYQEWCDVGMALKYEGCTAGDWDSWSRRDMARYHSGECERKWQTFSNTRTPCVTGGTIMQMAMDRGYGREMGGNLPISLDEAIYIDPGPQAIRIAPAAACPSKSRRPLTEPPPQWDPCQDIREFLERLFSPDDYVGYVMKSMEQKDRCVPAGRGVYGRKQRHIIKALEASHDVGYALGDYDYRGGAWVRINPLDGKGVRNSNVREFTYVLAEADDQTLQQQLDRICSLKLPVAALVYSGGKSLHAVVHIDAGTDYDLYRQRVDFLYKTCHEHGYHVDVSNRNPARLMRLPGIRRGESWQYLIPYDSPFQSYTEWLAALDDEKEGETPIENLSCLRRNPPPLDPVLIDGLLRQGHKMMLAGPSKAGKSFALIELCIAIAEGTSWLGQFPCHRGNVLYINLELNRASCIDRFCRIYNALGLAGDHDDAIDLWNCRGHARPMEQLVRDIVRRTAGKDYMAIVLDPIYKITDGDENSAHDMGIFCNQLDRLSTQKQCAVIYCHHYSKGSQTVKKAQDRASGSGVFSRDADAILDMLDVKSPIGAPPAFRIEAILREFAPPQPFYITFDYPIHHIDYTGLIASYNEDLDNLGRGREDMLAGKKQKCLSNQQLMREVFDEIMKEKEEVYIGDLMKKMGMSRSSIKRYIDESTDLERNKKGNVYIRKR